MQKKIEKTILHNIKDDDIDMPMQTTFDTWCWFLEGFSSECSESGISQQWKDKYALDVIGTSYCRTRVINIHREDFEILCDWQSSKQKLLSAYETWQKNNIDRLDLVEKTIKQYSVVDDVIELAKKIGFDLSERDLEIHSTEISFYNTNNVAQLLNDMKPKAKESRAKDYTNRQIRRYD